MKVHHYKQMIKHLVRPSKKVAEEKVRKELNIPKDVDITGSKISDWINYNNKLGGTNKEPITEAEAKIAKVVEDHQYPEEASPAQMARVEKEIKKMRERTGEPTPKWMGELTGRPREPKIHSAEYRRKYPDRYKKGYVAWYDRTKPEKIVEPKGNDFYFNPANNQLEPKSSPSPLRPDEEEEEHFNDKILKQGKYEPKKKIYNKVVDSSLTKPHTLPNNMEQWLDKIDPQWWILPEDKIDPEEEARRIKFEKLVKEVEEAKIAKGIESLMYLRRRFT